MLSHPVIANYPVSLSSPVIPSHPIMLNYPVIPSPSTVILSEAKNRVPGGAPPTSTRSFAQFTLEESKGPERQLSWSKHGNTHS
jgi:hypothetical protein